MGRLDDVGLAQHQDRLAPELQMAVADEEVAEGHAGADGANCQNYQRDQDHRRAFVGVVHRLLLGPGLAMEGHEHQPAGVEGGHQRGGDTQIIGELTGARGLGEGALQDHVLGIVAGEERDAGERDGAHPHGPVGPGHDFAQAAHLSHVLLVAERVDHRARAQEQ